MEDNLTYHLAILCRRIKVKRMLKGWTQKRLAQEIGFGADYINRIESGRRIPTLITLVKIANALGCQPFKLLK
jgi:transcriptional regulator with XRE-family HTH domain